jgi:hypothetical protein
MKIHTTNYINTFIEVATDTTANAGIIPPVKSEKKTVANISFELISQNPYRFTSDDILFQVYAIQKDLTVNELAAAREAYFSKGQACLRASPLTKRYGWGVHHDENGKVALYGMETPAYEKFTVDEQLKKVKAMKSSR